MNWDEYDSVVQQLTDANIEVDMLRHVIEQVTCDNWERVVERVLAYDREQMARGTELP